MNINVLKPPGPGRVYIEVIAGRAGPSLSVGDDVSGLRIAGPKPWGGGDVKHRFTVDAAELIEELKKYLPPNTSEQPK